MLCDIDLDKQFSPSEWSKRSQGSLRVKQHVEYIEKYSEDVRRSIPCKLNIPYGYKNREIIDVFGTDLSEDSPVVIYIHGGYWQESIITHKNNSFIAKYLYSNSIKSIFLGYQLCPEVGLDNLLENIQKALTVCLSLLDLSKIRGIHLSGHSAGAQIVAVMFKTFLPSLPKEQQSLFKSAFLIAGIYDLVPLLRTTYNDKLQLDLESAKSASPLHQKLIVTTNCEIFVIVAEYDSPKFIEQGEKMYNYLKNFGFQSKFVFINNVDHFDIIEDLYSNENELTKLIIDQCIKN